MVTSTNVTYTRNPFQYLQNTTEITTDQKPLYCKETKILLDAASVLSALDRMMWATE